MSSVQAVTQDIKFTVKLASFRPLPTDALIREFGAWIEQQAKERNFLVFSCSLEGNKQEYPK
jgi:hypothetical protein